MIVIVGLVVLLVAVIAGITPTPVTVGDCVG